MKSQSHDPEAGFTLVEAVVAMLVVATLSIAALRAVGAVGLQRMKANNQAVAGALADGMMSEILKLAYEELGGTVNFGIEGGELANNKSTFDDVDDFNNWTEVPPRAADNSSISELSAWKRTVVVTRVTSAAPSTVSATESGIKRINVLIYCGNMLVSERSALKGKL